MGAYEELAAISDQRVGKYFSYIGLGSTALDHDAEYEGADLGLTWAPNALDLNDDNYADWLEVDPATGELTVTEKGIYMQNCLLMGTELGDATPATVGGSVAPYQIRSDITALGGSPGYTLQHTANLTSSLTSSLARVVGPYITGFVAAGTVVTPGVAVDGVDFTLYVFVNTLEKVL